MGRKLKGIRQRGDKRRVYVKVNGKQYSKSFSLDEPIEKLQAWRDQQVTTHGGRCEASASFRADVETFLAKPEIADQQYVKHLRAYLSLWVTVLGGDRPRHSITRDEIETVLRRWLRTLKEPTVYHRRSALLLLFTTLDGAGTYNPVKETTRPKSWIPKDQSVPFATLMAIVDAMPDVRYVKKGIQQPSVAKLVARVAIAVGLRLADLLHVRRSDLDWVAGTFQRPASKKGQGVAARKTELSVEGLAAFRAFDAANAYGAFNPEAVSHSFKRAARRICGPDTPIHVYSMRHSVGADVYRTTGDLATVGRLLGHAPGSRATAQYAMGANADVDRAALIALTEARAAALTSAAAAPMAPAKATKKTPAAARLLRIGTK